MTCLFDAHAVLRQFLFSKPNFPGLLIVVPNPMSFLAVCITSQNSIFLDALSLYIKRHLCGRYQGLNEHMRPGDLQDNHIKLISHMSPVREIKLERH